MPMPTPIPISMSMPTASAEVNNDLLIKKFACIDNKQTNKQKNQQAHIKSFVAL